MQIIDMKSDPFNRIVFEQYRKLPFPIATLDIETTISKNPWADPPQLVSVAVSFDGVRAFVFDADEFAKYKRAMESIEWTMHNGLFDRLMMLEFFGYDLPLQHDTMALQYLLDPDEPKGLDDLVVTVLGLEKYKDVDYKNILDEPWEKIVQMNGADAIHTWNLYRPLADKMNDSPALSKVYQWIIMPAIEELIQATINGIPVDAERLKLLTIVKDAEAKVLQHDLIAGVPDPDPEVMPKGWNKPSWWRVNTDGKYEYPGLFNPASPHQVRYLLFDHWGMTPLEYTKDKDTGEDTATPSTNKDVLLLLETFHTEGKQQEWLKNLREYRKVTKLLSYYVSWPDQWDDKGWLHPRYKPLHVVTGRTASESPNIQQVPKDSKTRSIFGGVEGYTWMKADYSQLELRIAAWLANEPAMLLAFAEGKDLHAQTAELVLGDPEHRDAGKTLNFGLLYGAGPKTLQRVARETYGVFFGEDEAKRYRSRFFAFYPGLELWHKKMERLIVNTGMSHSPLGRVRYLPNAKIPWNVEVMRSKKLSAIREGINHPVQSFASDLLLSAMIRLGPFARELGIKLVAEVHDEIDFLVPDDKVDMWRKTVKQVMEDLTWLNRWGIDLTVPVLIDITTGPYWGQLT